MTARQQHRANLIRLLDAGVTITQATHRMHMTVQELYHLLTHP